MAKSIITEEITFFSSHKIEAREKKFVNSKKIFDRILLHKNDNDNMHIMLMFYKKSFSYPPHYSKNKTESFSA